jgi:hypothetical protein
MTDGNCQGYARQRTIAVSPLAELPEKTRFHELAHVVLGHTSLIQEVGDAHSFRSRRRRWPARILSRDNLADEFRLPHLLGFLLRRDRLRRSSRVLVSAQL